MSRKKHSYTTIASQPGWYRLELRDAQAMKTPVIAWVIENDFYENAGRRTQPNAVPVTATPVESETVYLLTPEGVVVSDETQWDTIDQWLAYERERIEAEQREREAEARAARREKIAAKHGREAREAAKAAGSSGYEALVAGYDAYEAAGGAQRRPSEEALQKQAKPAEAASPSVTQDVTHG